MTVIPFLQQIDLKLLDTQFEVLRKIAPTTAEKDVVIIGFDENTYQSFQEPFALWHSHFAEAFEALAVAKPSVVGLDFVLPDRSFNQIIPGIDIKLLKGLIKLRDVSPIVLGTTVNSNGVQRQVYQPLTQIAGKNSVGFVLFRRDDDRVIRTFYPDLGHTGKPVPTLVATMATHLGIETQQGIINYALGEPFNYIPIQKVIKLGQQGDYATLKSLFQNKPVLFGPVLPFEDRHYQPVNLAAWENANGNYLPGVLIHAQALRSVTNSSLITQVSPLINYVILIAITCLWWFKLTLKQILVVSILFLIGGMLGQFSLLAMGIFLPMTPILIAAFITLFGRYWFEQKN